MWSTSALALLIMSGTVDSQSFLLSAVRVSKAVLSVVGGTLVLGKHFQVLCHSDNGSLPITYTLSSPNSLFETRVVRNPGERAIFNVTALYKASDVSKLICSAKNSQHKPVVAEILHYTNIIGMIDAKALGNKCKPLSNKSFVCRTCVQASAENPAQHGGRDRGARCDAGVLRPERHSAHQLHLAPHKRRGSPHFPDL